MSKREDDPIRPEHRAAMTKLANLIEHQFFPGFGFTLLVFDLNRRPGEGFLNYISNARRADMCKAMREFIEHTEKKGTL